MAARIIETADALVAALAANWADYWAAAPAGHDSCERVYVEPAGDLGKLLGRHAWVSPVSFADTSATRAENLGAYTLGVVLAERFPDAGPPPRDWTDARVGWVQAVADLIGSYGNRRASGWLEVGTPARRLLSERIEVAVYDWNYLDKNRVFWAELEVELREVRR